MGVICNSQDNTYSFPQNQTVKLAGDDWLIDNTDHHCYRLKRRIGDSLEYLTVNNHRLISIETSSFVNQPLNQSNLFYLISDDICVSLIPLVKPELIICVERNSLVLKKPIQCAIRSSVTIFKYDLATPQYLENLRKEPKQDFTQDKRETPHGIIKPAGSKDPVLIKLHTLDPLQSLDLSWLRVIGPSDLLKIVPVHLRPYYVPFEGLASLQYLAYIVEHYHSLVESPKELLFLEKYPLQTFTHTYELNDWLITGPSGSIICVPDCQVSVCGTKSRYRISDPDKKEHWGEWQLQRNHPHQMSQRDFWIHVLKKTPTSQNISFPKDNWYIVPSTRVTDKPLRYFTRLLEYFQECNSLVQYNYLDRSWFEIFKHR